MSLKHSYISNLDWLSFSWQLALSVEEELDGQVKFECPAGLRLELLPGTNVYRQRAILYDGEGSKILTVLCNPYSSIIDKSIALCEVANQCLYGRWWDVVELLPWLHAGRINSLSRVDICVDFPAKPPQLALIQQFFTGEAYVQGKKAGVCFWDADFGAEGFVRTANTLTWGSRNSEVKWKCYNKSLEIHERVGQQWAVSKPYIVDMWRSVGWGEWGIWRLEVSLLDAGQFEWDGFPLLMEQLKDEAFIDRIFRGLYDKRFVQRLNERHACRKNDTRVWLLNFACAKRLRRSAPNGTATTPEGLSQLRAVLKQIAKPTALMNDVVFGALATAAMAIADECHLHQYVERVMGAPLDEVLGGIYEAAGSGIHEFDGKDVDRLLGK